MWMWFLRTDRTLIHLWKVMLLLYLLYRLWLLNYHLFLFSTYTFLPMFSLRFFLIVHKKMHLFSVSVTIATWRLILKTLVTDISIFKCFSLSWCFHLHSQTEDRNSWWRPLNGRVLTVYGLSWPHSIHLPLFGSEFVQRSRPCLQFDVSPALTLSQYLTVLWVRSIRCCLALKCEPNLWLICPLKTAHSSYGQLSLCLQIYSS